MISTPRGFNFSSTVVSHGWYHLAPFTWSAGEKTLRRIELLEGEPVELAIKHVRGALRILCEDRLQPVRPAEAGPHTEAGPDAGSELRTKITRMFQLNVDIAEFAAVAKDSRDHAWVVKAGFGRLLCGSTLFEDAIKIIATTNTTWRQTVRMVELLVAKCGRGGAFPEPADLARFSIDELQRDCRLGYRATTMHQLATGIVNGTIDLAAIADPSQTTEALFKSYRKLAGIGPYAAAHLLAMDGRHDFIAVDSEFRRYVRERYHKGRRISDAAMLRRYSKWGRWKYLAYWSELWSSVADRLQQTENARDQ